MNLKSIFLLAIAVLFTANSYAQRKFPPNSYNRLGIQGGITYGNLHSKDFGFIDCYGYTAGLSTRATAGEKIFFIYGVNFHEFKTGLETLHPVTLEPTEIDFKATGVQINLFLGHKLIREYLSLEIGPLIQINSKLTPEEGKENYILQEYNLTAADLEQLSRMNFSLAAGLSGGLPNLKLWVQYQYGISNLFNKFNYEELREKDPTVPALKANMRLVSAGLVFYF